MKQITVKNVTVLDVISKQINIYKSDTQNSITKRIARVFNTLPHFITFSSFNLDNQILFYDLKTFLELNFNGSSLSLVLRKYSTSCRFSETSKNKDMILGEWLKIELERKELERKDEDTIPDYFFVLGVKRNIRAFLNNETRFGIMNYDELDSEDDSNIIIKNIKAYVTQYKKLVKQIGEQEQTLEKTLREYENVSPLESEMFVSESTTFLSRTVKTDAEVDIRLMFDRIKTTELIPFVSFGNFYKVHSSQPILQDWTEQTNFSQIVLKIKSTDDVFSTCVVKVENGAFQFETELEKYDDLIINKITELLSVRVEETTEEKISGYFHVKFFFDKTVLQDIISTNTVFSSLLFTNELLKPSRERKSLYMYFDDPDKPEFGVTTLSLSNQTYKKLPDRLKIVSRIEKVNFLKCRIAKAKNRLAIHHITKILCGLLPLYSLEQSKIKKEYIKYIPDIEFTRSEEIYVKEDKDFDVLRSKVPDLFVKGYTRQCFNSPQIVDEPMNHDKSLFMKYPKDDLDAKWYTCDDEEYKYIGLKKPKKLKKLDLGKYPYIPCCYKENQIEKSGTKYYKYVKNIAEDLSKKQQDTIKTNKFVDFNHFGLLPPSLNNFFVVLNTEDQDFFRKGVSSVYHSFLECVYEALDDSFQITNKEQRDTMMKQKIMEINNDQSLLSIGKQEMYDSNEIKIEEAEYMSPEKWVSVLSAHFNCFIYTYKNVKGNVELSLPRHKNGHYETYKNMTTLSPVVLIYEHEGGEFDVSPVSRCELIIRRKNERTKYKHHFSKEQKHYTNMIRQIYSSLKRTKYTTQFITSSYTLKNTPVKIIKQSVDSFGKTRLIQLKYKTETLDIYTSPVQPFRVPILPYWNPILAKQSVVDDLFESDRKTECKITDKMHAVEGVIGDVKCVIPVKPITGGNLKQIYLPLVIGNQGLYNKFLEHRSKSKYMIEHVFHAYSAWMEDNQGKDVSEFFSNRVRLSSRDISYPLMFDNNRIVTIPSSSKDSVLHAVKLAESRDKFGLLNFKNKKAVEDAFTETDEYTKHVNETITTNDETWNDYLKRNDTKNKYYVSLVKAVNDFIVSEKQSPTEEYMKTDDFKNKRFMLFFSNPAISAKTVVLLKCVSRNDAILQSAHWKKYKYILPTDTTSNIDTILPDIYVYISRNTVEKKLRDGKSKILISKINNVEVSFAILEL